MVPAVRRDRRGEVVEAIRTMGGEAVANGDDVSDWSGAASLVQSAVDSFGRLDVLVNNAGILRDRMIVSTTEEEWDAVIRVTLQGPLRADAPRRRVLARARQDRRAGRRADRQHQRGAGLMGSVGQGNYGAAKAGIAALTVDRRRRAGATA